MKAARIHRYGGPDELHLEDAPTPEIGPRDLLVRVRAASVNPVDSKIRQGAIKVLVPARFPLTLGNDLSGIVERVGPAVTRFKVGDEIFARLDKRRIGAFAELAVVGEAEAALKPAKLSHVEAASLPLVGLTAWQALVELAQLKAGQSVLIHAGSGGVGTVAIQLARHLGARVLTTVGAKNVELVKRLGADVAIDYRAQRFEDVARDVDAVFDTQGGDTLLRSFSVVKRGGVVVTVGGKPDGKFARAWGLNPIVVLALTFMARKVTRLARASDARYEYLFMRASGEQLEKIAALADAGTLVPIVDRTFPLERVREALDASEAGRAVGKLVLTMPA